VCRKLRHTQGFTLVELLIVVAITGLIAAVAVPLFWQFLGSKKLEVAAEETANAMRFALSAAKGSSGYVLVDGSSAGRLAVFNSDATGAKNSAVTDPLTKRALDLDLSGGAFSGGVAMTPNFMYGGTACNQLLIGPGTQLQAVNNGSVSGALEAGSGVTLTLGSQSAAVAIDPVTGRVTLP